MLLIKAIHYKLQTFREKGLCMMVETFVRQSPFYCQNRKNVRLDFKNSWKNVRITVQCL